MKEALENIPDWLKEYVEWHNIQRRDHMNDPETKFLTMACLEGKLCGGISDRLRPLPFFLVLAKKMNRVLLIKWQKGFDLEEYLLPPNGGIDWRLPESMDLATVEDLLSEDVDWLQVEVKDAKFNRKKNVIVGHVGDHYDRIKKQYFNTADNPEGTFAFMWKILFKPVPKLQIAIDKTMKDLKLQPRKYVSAHYRTSDHELNMVIEGSVRKLDKTIDPDHDIENTIACAHKISPDKSYPIYFTSSNAANVKYAVTDNALTKKNKNVKVVGNVDAIRLHSEKPFRGSAFEDHDPSELYPAFIDLYLMSNGACVAFGKLGFGRLGAKMAGEKCMIDTRNTRCEV